MEDRALPDVKKLGMEALASIIRVGKDLPESYRQDVAIEFISRGGAITSAVKRALKGSQECPHGRHISHRCILCLNEELAAEEGTEE